MGKYIVENIKDFNLKHIFDCGQCFRWEREDDGSYTGIALGKVVNMAFEDHGETGTLIIDNCNKADFENIWYRYLDLDRDYGAIKKQLSHKDPIMAKAISYGEGIRILRQDLWETILSFLISQNNNIPRIKGCIEKLAAGFGTSAGTYNNREYFNLPTAQVLSKLAPKDLAQVKLGYRDRYLIESAKEIMEKGLPTDALSLSSLCGVGPKVANCIMLFGMEMYDSFPIDVWVKRVMHQLYGIDEENKNAMKVFAEKNFGKLGGFAQQYLFYYIREIS